MRYSAEPKWLHQAMTSVKEPLQFLALAYGSPVAVLLAAMLNGKMVSTLDKDGMLLLTGMMVFVQVAVLVVFAVIVRRPSDTPRVHGERAEKPPAKIP